VTDGNEVELDVASGTTGYSALTINSNGTLANDIDLDLGTATNTATITAAGAEALTIAGPGLNINNLHTFDGTGMTGNLSAEFTNPDGAGHVAATGGSGDNTFIFDATGAELASFTSASSVNGGTGTDNTLVIQANFDAIVLAGVGPNITNIQTIESTTEGLLAMSPPT
jgi:hypothetical protein